jgi:protocatechuate 3,4-dioxygenase alpha subunit
VYFPDEDNRSDPLLRSLERHERRETLVARIAEDGYRFDVRLQGEHETVFFAI